MDDRISSRQLHESRGVEDWRVGGDGACASRADPMTSSVGRGRRAVVATMRP